MVKPETPRGRASSPHESLGDMAMIRTKQLLIEARDSGPKTGPAILLVHAWPDDASSMGRHRTGPK
jgi:hypothetical protein